MLNQEIRLIAIDLDGTLLNENRELTKETIRIIKQVMEKGVRIVLCTGRPFAGIREFINQLDLNRSGEYCITNTGATVKELGKGTFLSQKSIGKKQAQKLKQMIKPYAIQLAGYTESALYNEDDPLNEAFLWDAELLKMPIERSFDAIDAFSRFNAMGEKEQLDLFQEKYDTILKKEYFTMRNETFSYEILHKDCGKGKALMRLMDHLGYTRKDVMAIGDNNNDIEMLEIAGFSVAMGNAKKRVKEIADVMTQTNEQNGAAKAIQKYLLKDASNKH